MRLSLVVCLLLAGCGTAPERGDLLTSAQALGGLPGALLGRQADFGPEVAGRSLEVAVPGLGFAARMVPWYPAKTGQTWIAEGGQSVTLQDGLLQQTRGFGPDLMAAQGPGIAQVRAGTGSFHRIHEYLDGGDRALQVDFDCDFSAATEGGLRVVTETCRDGDMQFQNLYRFGAGGALRDSVQLLAPGLSPMTLRAVEKTQ